MIPSSVSQVHRGRLEASHPIGRSLVVRLIEEVRLLLPCLYFIPCFPRAMSLVGHGGFCWMEECVSVFITTREEEKKEGLGSKVFKAFGGSSGLPLVWFSVLIVFGEW